MEQKNMKLKKKIEEGKYWENYPPITNIQSFLCYDQVSECEKKQPASSEKECFAAKAELLSEGCCYLESDWKEGDRHEKDIVGSCVDIRLEDSETEEKIEETKRRIISASYWEGIDGYATQIKKLVCANTKKKDDDKIIDNSSFLMKVNFLLLSLFLF